MKDNDELIKDLNNLIKFNELINVENYSNRNIKGNRNIEFPLGVHSEKNCNVLDAPNLVWSSAL
jgi:hypothetical protein